MDDIEQFDPKNLNHITQIYKQWEQASQLEVVDFSISEADLEILQLDWKLRQEPFGAQHNERIEQMMAAFYAPVVICYRLQITKQQINARRSTHIVRQPIRSKPTTPIELKGYTKIPFAYNASGIRMIYNALAKQVPSTQLLLEIDIDPNDLRELVKDWYLRQKHQPWTYQKCHLLPVEITQRIHKLQQEGIKPDEINQRLGLEPCILEQLAEYNRDKTSSAKKSEVNHLDSQGMLTLDGVEIDEDDIVRRTNTTYIRTCYRSKDVRFLPREIFDEYYDLYDIDPYMGKMYLDFYGDHEDESVCRNYYYFVMEHRKTKEVLKCKSGIQNTP